MLKKWIEAMRLRTLPVSIAGVLAGWGCAIWQGKFSIIPALLCLFFAIAAQIASNFGNEYYDFKNGMDRKGREEFMQGNFGFASVLLDTLKKYGNTCPVMISSSIQATLAGRFGTSEYGKSKKAGEELMFEYGKETGAKVLVYRFPNLFGKWCRPNYNSAVATFCNNIANDLPIQVNDRSTQMELVYVDDLVDEMINALVGKEHHCEFDGVETVLTEDGRYCAVPVSHHVTLGEIVDLLESFAKQPKTLVVPEIPYNSFAKKLYSTFILSGKIAFSFGR